MRLRRRFLTFSLAAAVAVTSLPGGMADTVRAAELEAGQQAGSLFTAQEAALAEDALAGQSSITIDDPIEQETVTSVRLNGTATFKVRAWVNDEDICSGIDYQWYSVAKDGKETKLDKENTNTFKVRVSEYDTYYKCVVTPRLSEGAPQQASQTRIFRTAPASGYKVNAITGVNSYLNIGEKATLSIEAEVDAGYTLKYNWTSEGGTASLGQAASLEVAPKDSNDFKEYYLKVTVEKDGKEVESHDYRFQVMENFIKWDSNDGTVTIEPGADATLYVKSEGGADLTVTRTWYKEIASAQITEKYNEQTGNYDVVFVDPNFKEPANDLREESGKWDDNGDWIKVYIYYSEVKEAKDKDILNLSGKKGDKYEDITGHYMCRAVCQRMENGKPQVVEERDLNFTVKCDSDLNAYAKNPTVSAVIGSAAKLEVVAGNKNTQLCPITYKWEKKNASTGAYEAVAGAASTASLTIPNVSEGSYGEYRVTVQDSTKSQQVEFKLVKKAVDYIAYTPDYTRCTKAIGEKADLKVDIQVSQGTEVFYEWYRSERHYYNSYSYTNENWELLNEKTNAYSVTVNNDRDYTDYKCIATFKTVDDEGNNISASHTFQFSVEKPYSFGLEATKPQEQYKKVGASADYGVRIVTDNAAITDAAVTYQWYRQTGDYSWGSYGEAIDNATTASYHVDALKASDFGTVTCVATYKDAQGKEYTATKRFTTYRYTDASLETESEKKTVALGENVVLKPVVKNPSNENLSYQWYRYNEKVEDGYYDDDDIYHEEYEYFDRQPIYGATADTYAINEIGTKEITRYECEISIDGALAFTYVVTLSEETEESGLTVGAKDGKYEVSAVLGKSAELAVVANSSKGLALKYQWMRYVEYWDDEVDGDVERYEAIGGATEASYKIAKVTNDSYGTYRCVVTDAAGNKACATIELSKTTGLTVGSDALYAEDAVGYEVSFGGSVTLKASASSDQSYEVFYQWYGPDGKMLYGQTGSTLKLTNITEDKLGYYSCRVYDAVSGIRDAEVRAYYVYVNTGLVVVPSCANVVAASNGSVKMFVKASANKNEKITYQWSKWDPEKLEYVDIANKASANYSISKLVSADYGRYRCAVSTRGEKAAYYFTLDPSYEMTASRVFAEQGNKITLNAAITNPASDRSYTYTWYVKEPSTGNYRKISGTSAKCSATAPKLLASDETNGYMAVDYLCVIGDKNTGDEVTRVNCVVNVLNKVTYSTKNLPETRHPFDTAFDMKAYKISGAKKLNIAFDAKSQLAPGETLYVIDKDGNYTIYGNYTEYDDNDNYVVYNNALPSKLSVNGDSVILLINGNNANDSYGYKVSSITAPVPAKGTSYTTGNVTYKVTKSDAKNGTVAVSGVKTKNITKASIKSTVKIQGYTFKVTAINSKAFMGCKKLTAVTVSKNVKTIGTSAFQGCSKLAKVTFGANVSTIGASAFQSCSKLTKVTLGSKVTTIGKNAFKNCSKLKTVTIGKGVKTVGAAAFANDKNLKTIKITSTVLKSVGKKAFTKVPKKAKVTVPKSKKAAYASLLKKGGLTGSVK